MRVSTHVSWNEGIKSNTARRKGIENEPDHSQYNAMKNVAEKCFEPLRAVHGKAIGISSFFRSEELNTAIGGSHTSQHCKGEAMDIDADIYDNGISNYDIGIWLRDNVEFDQLIFEYYDPEVDDYGWIHVSLKMEGKNRGQVLEAFKEGRRTKYKTFEG